MDEPWSNRVKCGNDVLVNATSQRYDVERASTIAQAGPGAGASPAALRAPRPSWRDPRLWVGVGIVAVCVLLGARLLATADDTVRVWAASGRLPAGTVVTAAMLEPQEVRFSSAALADRYLSADRRLPRGAVLERDVLPGELVPRQALGRGVGMDLAEVPIALGADAVPAGLRVGDVVDVWVAPGPGADGSPGDARADLPRAERVLQGVRVVAVPRAGSALGPASSRQVVVGVPSRAEGLLAAALAKVTAGVPVMVRQG